jgi:hypothetical protein
VAKRAAGNKTTVWRSRRLRAVPTFLNLIRHGELDASATEMRLLQE